MNSLRILMICCLCSIVAATVVGCTYHEHYYGAPQPVENVEIKH